MGVIFTNGFGIGTVPNNTGNAGSGQWYLATGPFGYQPGWTFGTITWPMNSGNLGNNYGTNDPNEISSGQSAGQYLSKYDAFGIDKSQLLLSMVGSYGTIMFSQGPHYIIYSFTPGVFTDTLGMFDSVSWSQGGPGGSSQSLTVIATSNTSFNGYSDGDNFGGLLTYNDSGIAPNNSQLVTVTINTSPYQFTITSDSFNAGDSSGSVCGTPQGQWGNNFSGFTVNESTNLYCGVYAHINDVNTLAQITNAYIAASATSDWTGYIFDVVWANGSTVTNGVVKVSFNQNNNNQIMITPVDPSNTNYLINDNNANNGTSLVGTFNFPATFTFKTPLDSKGGWC